MFLHKLMQSNIELMECAHFFFKQGTLLPDTYLIDLDALTENAANILLSAKDCDIQLYFMLKQLGRNPIVAHRLAELGYKGAVAVDFREAIHYVNNNIPLGNVGHLVQIPKNALEFILNAQPDIVTVYTVEKAREINDICKAHGKTQNIMLRVFGEHDEVFQGQSAGIHINKLEAMLPQFAEMSNVNVKGICNFPCFLYNSESESIEPTENMFTLKKAKTIMESEGYSQLQINAPSVCCVESMSMIKAQGGTHSEPGHGLSGTTPFHAEHDGVEKCAYVYLTEISHRIDNRSFCYGGGSYQRGHLKNALVGYDIKPDNLTSAIAVPNGNIDYHFELKGRYAVSEPVLMCFRTQMFVTRSNVAVISGIASGTPVLCGTFDALGRRIE